MLSSWMQQQLLDLSKVLLLAAHHLLLWHLVAS
jgi:hypothetical protein